MSRSPANSIPFTTRPASTSRHGIILRASVMRWTPENCATLARQLRRIFPDGIARREDFYFRLRRRMESRDRTRLPLLRRQLARRRNARNKNTHQLECLSRASFREWCALDSIRCAAISHLPEVRELPAGKIPGRIRWALLRYARTWPATRDKFPESERPIYLRRAETP